MWIPRLVGAILVVVAGAMSQAAERTALGNDPSATVESACPTGAARSITEKGEAAASSEAVGIVWRMLDAFARGSESEYVAWMTEDFLFQSDDPDFEQSFPNGMTRADERAFVARLFGGVDGLRAARVDLTVGPLRVETVGGGDAQRRATLDHLRARIALSDGNVLDLRDTRSVMELVLSESGWRIRRWTETHPGPHEESTLAHRIVVANESTVLARCDASDRDAAEEQIPPALALSPFPVVAEGVLIFVVALPNPGGTLELFDAAGRKIAHHDLEELDAGRHRVVIDATAIPPGSYVARLTQGETTAETRLAWRE